MNSKLIVFGSAETASLAKFYFDNDSQFRVSAFTVDDSFVDKDCYEGLPLIPFSEIRKKFPADKYPIHVALSYSKLNRLRQKKYEQVKKAGYQLVSYISSKSAVWPDIVYGDNCFILENQTIQPTVRIGNNVILWSGNHVGHGSIIGDHTYISSHVVISGNCTIGKRCFFGVNSTVRDFIQIADDCFISMDASVTRHLNHGSVVLSESSKVLNSDSKVAERIKSKYFNL
jgi:sugar O-acyltransferase (sialic acid O-acetyltransferase NeuD family)